VVVDTTRISKVMPEINSLVYAGYPVQELCEHCRFEEVAWLIWHGELPTAKQLADLTAAGRTQREISKDLIFVVQKSPRTAHPMDVLRTGCSALGCLDAVASALVENACERPLFASAEAVAAAVEYVDARFSLLASSAALVPISRLDCSDDRSVFTS
jgi:citrate synthase